MLTYYAKKGFTKVRNEGPVALGKASHRFLNRQLHHLYNRLKIRKNMWKMQRQFDAVADPNKIISVNSEEITGHIKHRPWRHRYDVWGLVKGGNWDIKNTQPIEKRYHVKSFIKHFIHGVPWEECGIIQRKASKSLPYKGFKTRDELRQHFREKYTSGKYDELYQDIKQNGFQTPPNPGLSPCAYHAPHMAIGRDGKFLHRGEGSHRVAIAKVLELDHIPVYVYLRHKQWQDLRDRIYNEGLPEEHEDLRDHPDLQDILD